MAVIVFALDVYLSVCVPVCVSVRSDYYYCCYYYYYYYC